MHDVFPRIAGGLGREQIELMHQRALELIEETGIRVAHEGVLRLLADHEGVRICDQRVHFQPHLVERSLDKQTLPEWPAEEFAVISGAYAQNTIDLETGKLRPPTTQDLINLTKLADSYGMYGSAPVRPLDIPNALLQEIAMYKISWENSARRGAGIFEAQPKSTIEVAEYVYEMSQVADRYFSLGLWVISPLTLPEDGLEIIYHFLDRKVPMWVATMPIMGVTAPLSLAGAYIQALAELLGGLTLLHLISRGGPVYIFPKDCVKVYPFDMKYGSFVYGSPEDILTTLLHFQLNEYYGIPLVGRSLLTHGKEPDAQAAAEKAAHTMVAALAGARIFTGAGLLAVDDIYSPEQVVIDHEIVSYVRRVIEGGALDEEELVLAAIKEVGPGGSFLAHETTLARFREAFWLPPLFEHRTLRGWQEAGAPSIRERARALAKERIARHEFRLDEHVQRELDAIYVRALRSLA